MAPSSPASMAMRSAWESSARTRRNARRTCAPACRSPHRPPAANPSTRKSICWSGDWRGAACWNTASCVRKRTRTQVVIEPQMADYWPQDGAARRRRHARAVAVRLYAPARQRYGAGIAARRRAVPDLRSEARGRPRDAVHAATDQTAAAAGRLSRASSCSPCWWIAKSCSRSARATSGLRPAEGDADLVLWDFHDLLFHTRSTRRPPRQPAGRPLSLCGQPCRRCRRCGRAGPAKKSTCANSRPRRRRRHRRSRNCCVSGIRPAISMPGSRSRSRSWRDFSMAAARVQYEMEMPSSISAAAARWSATPRGLIPSAGSGLRARALSGRRQLRRACARILSLRRRRTRAGADRCAARRSSKRC